MKATICDFYFKEGVIRLAKYGVKSGTRTIKLECCDEHRKDLPKKDDEIRKVAYALAGMEIPKN